MFWLIVFVFCRFTAIFIYTFKTGQILNLTKLILHIVGLFYLDIHTLFYKDRLINFKDKKLFCKKWTISGKRSVVGKHVMPNNILSWFIEPISTNCVFTSGTSCRSRTVSYTSLNNKSPLLYVMYAMVGKVIRQV